VLPVYALLDYFFVAVLAGVAILASLGVFSGRGDQSEMAP
jgi:hypothetical protein